MYAGGICDDSLTEGFRRPGGSGLSPNPWVFGPGGLGQGEMDHLLGRRALRLALRAEPTRSHHRRVSVVDHLGASRADSPLRVGVSAHLRARTCPAETVQDMIRVCLTSVVVFQWFAGSHDGLL